jgi:hypothetical protein
MGNRGGVAAGDAAGRRAAQATRADDRGEGQRQSQKGAAESRRGYGD